MWANRSANDQTNRTFHERKKINESNTFEWNRVNKLVSFDATSFNLFTCLPFNSFIRCSSMNWYECTICVYLRSVLHTFDVFLLLFYYFQSLIDVFLAWFRLVTIFFHSFQDLLSTHRYVSVVQKKLFLWCSCCSSKFNINRADILFTKTEKQREERKMTEWNCNVNEYIIEISVF